MVNKVETTGEADAIQVSADRNTIFADGEDVSVISIKVNDAGGLMVPTADNEIIFTLDGPGKIIGVGNGDPSSHEADRFFERIKPIKIENLKELSVNNLDNRPEVAAGFDDSAWQPALKSSRNDDWCAYTDTLLVIRGTIELPDFTNETEVNLFTKSIVEHQSVYINGYLLAANIKRNATNQSFRLDHSLIKPGKNVFAVVGQRFKKTHQWDEPNTDPGLVQAISPSPQWKRHLFNGLAQVIVQSTKQSGELILKATAGGLRQAVIKIQTRPVHLRSAMPAE
jgi:beta-galactosidase